VGRVISVDTAGGAGVLFSAAGQPVSSDPIQGGAGVVSWKRQSLSEEFRR
jgi:hypothetical protein